MATKFESVVAVVAGKMLGMLIADVLAVFPRQVGIGLDSIRIAVALVFTVLGSAT